MILRFIFFLFLAYIGYRLLFDFIIPVVRTTRRVKRGFREMNERMQQATGDRQHSSPNTPPPAQASPKTKAEDYIDFEEVKD